MPDEVVLDASVAAKCFFQEAGSAAARRLVQSGARLIAPELIFAEMASIAAKQVRRGGAPREAAGRTLAGLRGMLDEAIPLEGLADAAFDLAARHGFSAYDGMYLALARSRRLVVATADAKFARRADEVGLSEHISLLAGEN
jgi:predicted nucleic acid-binding protein